MKHGTSLAKRVMGGIVSVLFLSAVVISCDDDDDAPAPNNDPYTVNGIANGDQMVPDTVHESGTATFTGSYDPANGRLIYTTNWANLTGDPIGGGIYSGDSATIGTVVDTSWVFDSLVVTPSGSVQDTLLVTTDQANDLIAGKWYFLFKTEAYPEGEVRGKLTATR
jgi:hypothetical protein